jgi:hypothetical protein
MKTTVNSMSQNNSKNNSKNSSKNSSKSNVSSTKFPDDVIVALHEAAITTTCMPIQIDEGDWQAAFFYVLQPDAPCLTKGKLLGSPYAVSLEADLHEHENGTLIEIAFDIVTPIEPCRGVLLFLTGHTSTHFDALKLLSSQQDIPLFIGDEYCNTLAQQRIPTNDAFRQGLDELVKEAVGRDAFIRLSGRYDPDLVFADTLAKRQMV